MSPSLVLILLLFWWPGEEGTLHVPPERLAPEALVPPTPCLPAGLKVINLIGLGSGQT